MTSGVLWALLAGVGFGIGQLANRGVNRTMGALAAETAMVTAMLIALLGAVAISGELGDLVTIPAAAVLWFTLAALVHFLAGWTMFAISQQRIGPSRTAAVLSTNPVMAAIIAAAAIGQTLRPVTWLGVVAVSLGVATIAVARGGGHIRSGKDLRPILGATLMFSISPIFVTFGLDHFDRPLLGLTAGIALTLPLMYGFTRWIDGGLPQIDRKVAGWVVAGGIGAGVALVSQWTAFDLITVGAVISLQQISTPVVLFAGPIVLAAPRERPDARLLAGTALIVAGAILVALFGRSVA